MEENKYWNEEETMEFLRLKETSLRNLVNKKLLSKYQIGVRYFYDPNEIMALIEASHKRDRSIQELKNYENIPPFRRGEHQFIVVRAKYILRIIEDLNVNWLSDREKDILLKTISYTGDFETVAKEYDLTRDRIRQIFEKALKRLRAGCLRMKNEYDRNYTDVHEENIKLHKENRELKEYIAKLPDEKKKQIDAMIDKSGVLSLPITELDLTVRTYNCMNNADVKTLGEIVSHTKSELMRFRNFGKKSLEELEDIVRKYDLRFGWFQTS